MAGYIPNPPTFHQKIPTKPPSQPNILYQPTHPANTRPSPRRHAHTPIPNTPPTHQPSPTNPPPRPTVLYQPTHPASTRLSALGHEITTTVRPRAILVFSAHWQSHPSTLAVNTAPSTPLIYDFSGFPA